MSNTNKIKKYGIGITAISCAALAGSLFGPGMASAQEDTEPAETVESDTEDKAHEKGRKGCGDRLEVLEGLGISEETVTEGRKADKSLAQIADEAGVSENDLVEALVDARIEKAEEKGKEYDEAEIQEKIESKVNTPPSESKGKRNHSSKA